jgi:purine-nucleoside phosphorylase
MTRTVQNEVEALTASLRTHDIEGCELAFVLGSGLGVFAERLENARAIPYETIEHMPQSAVPGHAGKLVVGEVAGRRVLVQQGRVHLYEGWNVHEVTRAARAFVALGCRGIILTNAAGSLRAEWEPGSLMRIDDHMNCQGETPLTTAERGSGSPYSPELGEALAKGAREAGVDLKHGVYGGLLGPNYETPAEIRMLGRMGIDAVGMSTVSEALAARAAGARVAAISCITNPAAGITGEKLSHDEVIETGKAAADSFCALLTAAVPHLLQALDG